MRSIAMLNSRSGSIHDLDHAPEAPAVSSLTISPRNSPQGSFRSTLSLVADSASLCVRFDPETEHSDAPVASRRRLDSAPGRLDYIPEAGELLLADEDSDISSIMLQSQSHSRARANSDCIMSESTQVQGTPPSPVDHDLVLEEYGHDLVLDRMDDSEYFRDLTSVAPPDTSGKGIFASFNFNMPLSQYYDGCGVTRMTACLVRNAPCFWFCGNFLEVGATDRSILFRLNILCAFFALGQVTAGTFLLIILNSDRVVDRYNSAVVRTEDSTSISLDLWNLNGSVFLFGIIGLIILVTVLCTLKIVREVNLRGAVRYLWTMLWLLPLQIFFVISLFDYHRVTQVWVRHWWYLPSMAWLRKAFCEDGTFNTLCVVPVDGGENSTSELQWCVDTFNSTNCTDIRDSAQNEVTRFMYIFYSSCGGEYWQFSTATPAPPLFDISHLFTIS